jgi:hypothetical protein
VDRKGKPPQAPAEPSGAERRRQSRIVHDDRGNASVEWVDVPDDSERTRLSVEDVQAATRPERGYNPYDTPAAARNRRDAQGAAERPPRRDLRKLSEWIKQMRLHEERKRRGDDDEQ